MPAELITEIGGRAFDQGEQALCRGADRLGRSAHSAMKFDADIVRGTDFFDQPVYEVGGFGRVVGCLKSTLIGAVAEVAGAVRGGLGRFVALVGYDVAAARKVLIDAAAGLSVEQRRTVARAAALLHEGMRILTRDFAQCDAGGDRGEPSKLRALTCISTLIIQASGGR